MKFIFPSEMETARKMIHFLERIHSSEERKLHMFAPHRTPFILICEFIQMNNWVNPTLIKSIYIKRVVKVPRSNVNIRPV